MYWLSFCDPEKPEGHAFLGVAIIDTDNFPEAVDAAWRLEINPGGEVVGMPLPEQVHHLVASHTGRLLSREDAQALSDAINAANSTKH